MVDSKAKSAGIFRMDEWAQKVRYLDVMAYVIIPHKGKPITNGRPWELLCAYIGCSGCKLSDGSMCFAFDEKQPDKFYNETHPFNRAKEHSRCYRAGYKIHIGASCLEESTFPVNNTHKNWNQFQKYINVYESGYEYEDLWVEVFVPNEELSPGQYNTFGKYVENFLIHEHAKVHGLAPLGNLDHLPPDLVERLYPKPKKPTRALVKAQETQSLMGLFK